MYTNGEVIIEIKELIIELTTEKITVIYLFRTKSEAYDFFMTLIMAQKKINN